MRNDAHSLEVRNDETRGDKETRESDAKDLMIGKMNGIQEEENGEVRKGDPFERPSSLKGDNDAVEKECVRVTKSWTKAFSEKQYRHCCFYLGAPCHHHCILYFDDCQVVFCIQSPLSPSFFAGFPFSASPTSTMLP